MLNYIEIPSNNIPKGVVSIRRVRTVTENMFTTKATKERNNQRLFASVHIFRKLKYGMVISSNRLMLSFMG